MEGAQQGVHCLEEGGGSLPLALKARPLHRTAAVCQIQSFAMSISVAASDVKTRQDQMRRKHQWQRDAQTLQHRAALLDRDRSDCIARLARQPEFRAALQSASGPKEHQKEEAELVRFVRRCRHSLMQLRRMLERGPGSKTREHFLDNVRTVTQRLEQEILEYKSGDVQLMQDLALQEKMLQKQLQAHADVLAEPSGRRASAALRAEVPCGRD